jgi:hypothetical protein
MSHHHAASMSDATRAGTSTGTRSCHATETGRYQSGWDVGTRRGADAFTPALKKVTYLYDLGAGWQHEVAMERVGERMAGQIYPVCVAFKGDSPVEYWSEEDSQEPDPFDLAEVNQRLAAVNEEDR